ncbi:unnamed protein product [Moneuplotes crassus]|uniref:Uncharacterized protein n=1 Tax=Euplotes crassus TaxID=5936 RepID=A0AAD1Y9C6_EUPCR|nr:unnamed protein product [Moneuplotes crassus]
MSNKMRRGTISPGTFMSPKNRSSILGKSTSLASLKTDTKMASEMIASLQKSKFDSSANSRSNKAKIQKKYSRNIKYPRNFKNPSSLNQNQSIISLKSTRKPSILKKNRNSLPRDNSKKRSSSKSKKYKLKEKPVSKDAKKNYDSFSRGHEGMDFKGSSKTLNVFNTLKAKIYQNLPKNATMLNSPSRNGAPRQNYTVGYNDCSPHYSNEETKTTDRKFALSSFDNAPKSNLFQQIKTKRQQEQRENSVFIKKLEEDLLSHYNYYCNCKDGKNFSAEYEIKDATNKALDKVKNLVNKNLSNVIKIAQRSFNDCMEVMMETCKKREKAVSKANQKSKDLESRIQDLEKQTELLENENAKLQKEKKKANAKLKNLQKESNLFMGKFDEAKILKEIKDLIAENENIRDFAREIKSELEYGRQRENKLMYFLYVLQKKEFPVYDIFEADIKSIPTYRFSINLDEEYKKLYEEFNPPHGTSSTGKTLKLLNNQNVGVDSSVNSSLPLETGPAPAQNKPMIVPDLDLNGILNKQLKKQPENTNFAQDKFIKNKGAMSAGLAEYNRECSEDPSEEEDCDCTYCRELHHSSENSNIQENLSGSNSLCNKILSPEDIEARNRRVEQILKRDDYQNYRLIRDLNKMQEMAESFNQSQK